MVLRQRARDIGIEVIAGFDFDEFANMRLEARGAPVYPFFEPKLNAFEPENAFWVKGMDEEGNVVYLDAFRLDLVDRDFVQWFTTWMFGLRARAQAQTLEMLHDIPLASNRIKSLAGRLVYQGELWISPAAPRKLKAMALETIPRFSMLLAYIHFRPDAIWAIVEERGVVTGGVLRGGIPHVQPHFVQWTERRPADTPFTSEWLATMTRDEIELMIREIVV